MASASSETNDQGEHILLASIVNVGLGGVFLLLFFFLRTRDAPFFSPRRKRTLPGWSKEVFERLDDAETAQEHGLDALLYLKFQCMVLLYLCGCTVAILPVALTLNIHGGNHKDGFVSTTVGNVPQRAPILYVHVGLLLAFWFATFLLLHRIISAYVKAFNEHATYATPADYTIMVRGLHPAVTDAMLRSHFEEICGEGSVLHARHVRDYRTMVRLIKEQENTMNQLEHCIHEKVARAGVQPVRRRLYTRDQGWFPKVDMIAFLTQRATELQQKIDDDDLLNTLHHPRSGVAFVVFTTMNVADTCLRKHKMGRGQLWISSELQSCAYRIKRAPPPEEVLWANIHIRRGHWLARWTSVNACVLLINVLWQIPIVLLADYHNVVKIPGIGDAIKAIVEAHPSCQPLLVSWIPASAMALFRGFLPYILMFFAKRQGFKSVESQDRSITKKYFVFLIINALVLPIFFFSALDFFQKIANNEHIDWVDTLGKVFISSRASLFINYLTFLAILVNVFYLLRVPEFVIHWLALRRALTRKEIEEANRVVPFEFHIEYSSMLVCLAIILLFSTMVPLILPAGILLFSLKYLADKYNLTQVHPPIDTFGKLLPTVLHLFLVCVLISQVGIVAFLSAYGPTGVAALLLFFALPITLIFHVHVYRKVRFVPCRTGALDRETLGKAYEHPVLRTEPRV